MPAPEPARILVVDDEPGQMKALCSTLRDQGYITAGFTSPNEALTALRSQKFDLLLTDLTMPEMDGISLLRAALEVDGDLVGIMMTGHGVIDTAIEAMKTGALDYILKPFKMSVILPVLARALDVRRLRLEKAELEKRVRERTAALEAANKELEAFSHSVSHDLRAPVRAVGGYSQMLLRDGGSRLPESDQHLLRLISDCAEQMGRMIDGLLRFSRLGRESLSMRPVNVAALVKEVLAELQEQEATRHIELRVGDLPDCIGDPLLLKQVLSNLLSNAFKFTRETEQALIEVGCQQPESERIYFVRDNGAGFDMRYAQKLFVVFQRLHSSEAFEGTGVGLSIAQRIIERHGGRIWAEAEVGKGATFFFTLPGHSP